MPLGRYVASGSTFKHIIVIAAASAGLNAGGLQPPEMSPSLYFLLHTLNSGHVVVKNDLQAATIPFDGYARPILFNDGALIGWIVLPANAVERLEKSGLVAGHCRTVIEREVHIDAAKAKHSLEESPKGGERTMELI